MGIEQQKPVFSKAFKRALWLSFVCDYFLSLLFIIRDFKWTEANSMRMLEISFQWKIKWNYDKKKAITTKFCLRACLRMVCSGTFFLIAVCSVCLCFMHWNSICNKQYARIPCTVESHDNRWNFIVLLSQCGGHAYIWSMRGECISVKASILNLTHVHHPFEYSSSCLSFTIVFKYFIFFCPVRRIYWLNKAVPCWTFIAVTVATHNEKVPLSNWKHLCKRQVNECNSCNIMWCALAGCRNECKMKFFWYLFHC